MTDEAEKFFELRDEIDRDAQIFAEAAAKPVAETADDASGTITVALDVGGDITVTIAEGWRDGYRPGALGDGIVQTFQGLIAERTSGWMSNLGDSLEQERRTRPIPSLDESFAGKLQSAIDGDEDSSESVVTVLENVLSFLEDVSANFDGAFDSAVQRGLTTELMTPHSKNMTVELSAGGDLVGITFSESWLERTSAAQISRELNSAIAEARSRGAEAREAGPLDGTALAKYQRYIDDQDAFVAFLRGKE